MAGKSGLNLTHSEPFEQFLSRYGGRRAQIEPMLKVFGPDELRTWAQDLEIETFVGTSGRVFPIGMKASPLLRAWLKRLGASGVSFHPRHKWTGFQTMAPAEDGGLSELRFEVAKWRYNRKSRCGCPRPWRRELVQARLGRRLGSLAEAGWSASRTATSLQLWLRRGMDSTFPGALRRISHQICGVIVWLVSSTGRIHRHKGRRGRKFDLRRLCVVAGRDRGER